MYNKQKKKEREKNKNKRNKEKTTMKNWIKEKKKTCL